MLPSAGVDAQDGVRRRRGGSPAAGPPHAPAQPPRTNAAFKSVLPLLGPPSPNSCSEKYPQEDEYSKFVSQGAAGGAAGGRALGRSGRGFKGPPCGQPGACEGLSPSFPVSNLQISERGGHTNGEQNFFCVWGEDACASALHGRILPPTDAPLAYTSNESTNYHFDVNADALEPALDRWVGWG